MREKRDGRFEFPHISLSVPRCECISVLLMKRASKRTIGALSALPAASEDVAELEEWAMWAMRLRALNHTSAFRTYGRRMYLRFLEAHDGFDVALERWQQDLNSSALADGDAGSPPESAPCTMLVELPAASAPLPPSEDTALEHRHKTGGRRSSRFSESMASEPALDIAPRCVEHRGAVSYVDAVVGETDGGESALRLRDARLRLCAALREAAPSAREVLKKGVQQMYCAIPDTVREAFRSWWCLLMKERLCKRMVTEMYGGMGDLYVVPCCMWPCGVHTDAQPWVRVGGVHVDTERPLLQVMVNVMGDNVGTMLYPGSTVEEAADAADAGRARVHAVRAETPVFLLDGSMPHEAPARRAPTDVLSPHVDATRAIVSVIRAGVVTAATVREALPGINEVWLEQYPNGAAAQDGPWAMWKL